MYIVIAFGKCVVSQKRHRKAKIDLALSSCKMQNDKQKLMKTKQITKKLFYTHLMPLNFEDPLKIDGMAAQLTIR